MAEAKRPLPRRPLGRSRVEVTTLGFGGAALGNLFAPVSDADAEGTLRAAWAGGVRYFDTAPYYGYGLAEERLGRGLAAANEPFALSSKVGRRLVPRPGGPREDQGFVAAHAFDPVFDYSHEGVMRSFESSCARLGRDHVDVLLLHDVGARTHGPRHRELLRVALDGGLRALQELRAEGSIGAIGLGVNECEVCLEVLGHADLDVILLAGRYTLLEQGGLDGLLPECEKRGTSIVVGGPFNSGLLAAPPGEGARYDYAPAPPEVLARARAIAAVCAAHRVPLASAALQFPLLHPIVASVIPGARSAAEASQNAEHMAQPIPPSLWSDLVEEGLLRRDAPTGAAG